MDFGLEFEYKCAKLFYQDNEGKAFKLSYDQKLHFIALSKQIAKGPYDPEKPDTSGYEVSYFNLVGNDRKAAWQRLGSMGKQDAMMEFVGKLRENCTSFDPWYRAHVKIEQEKRKLENSSLLDCIAVGENGSSFNPPSLSPEKATTVAANGCESNDVMNSVANGGDLVKNGRDNNCDVNTKKSGGVANVDGANLVANVGSGTSSNVSNNMNLTGNDRSASGAGNNNNNNKNSARLIPQAATSADKKKDAQSNNAVGKSCESGNFIGSKNINTDVEEIGDCTATTGSSLQHLQQIEEQTTLIKNALNAQTFRQFKQYAVSRYPEDEKAQDRLISELQQQHFQQYMQHIYYQQMAQMKAMQNANNVAMNLSVSSGPDSQQISPNSKLSFEKETTKTAGAPNSNDSNTTHHPRPESFVHFDDEVSNKTSNEDTSSGGGRNANAMGGATSLSSPPASESLLVANPSMWANKNMKEFKELVKKDSNLVIRVGRGELVTIRVPTHEDGSFLFWEFATDSYDIGFGLHFEWTISPTNEITITAEEPEEDEDEEVLDSGNPNDVEKMTHFDRVGDKPALDVIVPIYRRDSHLEVQAGSHEYPGQGCYLLKFDNTFSLFRGKTLYYRVYYTK